MYMRRALILLALFALVGQVVALAPRSVSITVFLTPSGVANVREDYLFIFSTPQDRNEFIRIAKIAGDSFPVWSSYIPEVTYYVGTDLKDVQGLNLYWVDLGDTAARLVVSYSVPAAFPKRDLPTAREYIINSFRFPLSAGAMHIPAGYTITVYLPQNAKILDYAPKLSGKVGNPVVWKGPLSVGSMYIVYSIPKPAAAPSLISLLSGTPYSLYVLGLLVLLAVLLILRWNRIKKSIERYVSENTHFGE